MFKIFYTSSENNKNFGVSRVVDELKRNLKKEKINIKFSNNLNDFFTFKPNMVHIHGCWKLHLLVIFLFSKIKGIKTVISPHGMIDPFSFHKKNQKKHCMVYLSKVYFVIL